MARGKNNNRGSNNNNNNKQGAGAKICSICNKPGHLAKDCLSNKKCTNCGMTGHLAAKCRSKNGTNGNNNGNQQNNNNGGKFCNFCNMKGHTDANCHKNPASFAAKTLSMQKIAPNEASSPQPANTSRKPTHNNPMLLSLHPK
jgi:hypothetical protein